MKLINLLFCAVLVTSCTKNETNEKDLLLKTIDAYETAWANGDFLTVESFFTQEAKRLHTEPHVWDRAEIKRYFETRAANQKLVQEPTEKQDWKMGREYIDIRVEGNIAYDIFTTERFKAVHIWEKQNDGSWKIQYDIGMLNYVEEIPMPK
ncbi:nuclear transport factor 2 family protein [Mariniflexile gromovii]|uniref:Nuclear transport factor 2 family protein n=1 Tax=Mariniflexile gromovii TaxID=362523 RepID=A0ABS4BYF9_9FLAO|nr:nuclear transport factor 2 family protein [Mariniflexile gromovii]MBP0905428.1 nuclear transport factor 2 family protein [Mariniflexile gromovii]